MDKTREPLVGTREHMVAIYRKRAERYDVTANRFYLIGFRAMAYRREAVRELALKPGDTVVDAGCGTGINFPALQEAVGPSGRIIGVDLTDAMLEKAQERVDRHGWENVTLTQADLKSYAFPAGANGILACYSVTIIPEFREIIANGYQALAPGGRWVVLDYSLPGWWPRPMEKLLNPLFRPFGGDVSMAVRKPWEDIARHGETSRRITHYAGWSYIAVGEAKATESD